MDRYSIFDAARILGKDHTAIREWIKLDFIELEGWQYAKGRGTKTVLTKYDLYRIRAFQVMLSAGIGRASAASVIHSLRSVTNIRWDDYFIMFGRSSQDNREGNMVISLSDKHESLFDMKTVHPLQLQITLSLAAIKTGVDAKIE